MKFLIVVTFLGAVQSTIPDRCKKEEAGHMNRLESQVADIKHIPSTISTHKIDMVADYPQYLFLMTPITSSRLIVSPHYSYYPQELLILENTAFFKKVAGNNYITLSNQTIFRKNVNFELMDYPHGSMSFTGSKSLYLTVEPISSGGNMVVEDLQITFESVNPSYWKSIPGYEVVVKGDEVTIKKKGLTSLNYIFALICGGSTGTEVNYSKYASQNWNLSTQTKLIQKVDHPLVFRSNETELLDILLTVDGYNNPVEGCVVEGTATLGRIVPQTEYTDAQGEALFLYAAPEVKHDDEKGTITFSCPNCTTQKIITYEVKVLSEEPGCDNR